MIGRLTGRVAEKTASEVIVDVGGVGYLVHASISTLAALPKVGAETTLRIHTHVRDDALELYGFVDPEEEMVFRQLIQTPNIGCKKALAILSSLPAREVVEAVRAGDVRRLARAHGIGKKTAERLVLELKDRLAQGEVGAAGGHPTEADLVAGLVGLGFKEDAARRAAREAIAERPEAELAALLKEAIARLRG
ncbi:MAG: Holliday junction branch migration protein RuvA [Deltaproteobacteria bacterium]|nr:MAG: Holliday junction branch migration protein RuvA [Deltaproteobacteria bacterium]